MQLAEGLFFLAVPLSKVRFCRPDLTGTFRNEGVRFRQCPGRWTPWGGAIAMAVLAPLGPAQPGSRLPFPAILCTASSLFCCSRALIAPDHPTIRASSSPPFWTSGARSPTGCCWGGMKDAGKQHRSHRTRPARIAPRPGAGTHPDCSCSGGGTAEGRAGPPRPHLPGPDGFDPVHGPAGARWRMS